MKHHIFIFVFLLVFTQAFGQTQFSKDPLNAQFVKHDYDNFWKQFDKMESSSENPFGAYLANASIGLKPYVGYFNVDSLYQTVVRRKAEYLKSRPILQNIGTKKKKIIASYAALKYWYPEAVFPPIYFVVADFSTGGTVSENGLLIGSEKLKGLEGLHGLVTHELIHFQQKYTAPYSLLNQSIKEGSADFLGELISGEHINMTAFNYGEQHEDVLCKEFVAKMLTKDETDWLYGTSGKDDRPNDLGYWIGYKITEAYFNKQKDKRKAVADILNVSDPLDFLRKSGYLESYLKSQK
jgi:hypothetical protein